MLDQKKKMTIGKQQYEPEEKDFEVLKRFLHYKKSKVAGNIELKRVNQTHLIG